MSNVADLTTNELRAELAKLTALRAWRGRYPLVLAELCKRNPQRVELAQDSYYYGTAADFTSAHEEES